MNTVSEIFGEVIHAYTRADAIADGVLIDLSALFPDLTANAGIRYHVACTAAVYAACIEMTPAAEHACNDLKGRAWDVLHMFRMHALAMGKKDRFGFQVHVVRERVRPTPTTLYAVCGPDDDGAPCITIMFPHED